jgi:microcystin-dependent protein
MAISISRPTVGGSEDTWGATINTGLQAIESTLNGTGTGKVTVAPDLSTLTINGTDVTSTAAELNLLDGKTAQDFLPSGVILLWSGSIATIPTGWVLCDGTNSTPDLRDRFVVGADADSGGDYAPNATGGAASVTLTTSQIPAHSHTATSTSSVSDPGHAHSYTGSSPSGGTGDSSRQAEPTGKTTGSATTGISVSTSTSISNTGGGGSHENRPPYYALAYIMKT